MSSKYTKTIYTCFAGYIVQAIVNNFLPLLFLTFQTTYQISLSKITLLVTINFALQLFIDLISPGFIDRIGYRASAVLAHVLAGAGLASLAVFPDLMGDPFVGLLMSISIYAIGGGLLEVLISPIVEACPTDHKEKAMSMLHSFYCWGHVGVILLSTLFFACFGIQHWKILAVLWSLLAFINAVCFTRVPIASLLAEHEEKLSLAQLMKNKIFWILMLLMMCSGACEHGIAQWASAFAEQGLHVSKTVGDLAGPMLFAIMMGISRTIYGKFGERLNLERYMLFSAILCAGSYLLISLSPIPVLSLVGCGLCGFAVGIFWPGTFSIAASTVKRGGTAVFALLALAGDLGCSGGPTFVGLISGAYEDNLKVGILAGTVFAVIFILGLFLFYLQKNRKNA